MFDTSYRYMFEIKHSTHIKNPLLLHVLYFLQSFCSDYTLKFIVRPIGPQAMVPGLISKFPHLHPTYTYIYISLSYKFIPLVALAAP